MRNRKFNVVKIMICLLTMNKSKMTVHAATLCFIFMLPLIMFISCENNTNTDSGVDIADMYTIEIGEGSMLYKYNSQTDTRTPVCDDPLCDHHMFECKFAGVTAMRAYNSTIYFLADSGMIEEHGERKLMQTLSAYNYVTGDYNILYETAENNKGGISYRFDYSDGYLYFYKKVLEGKETRKFLQRVDVDTKKVEELFVSDNVLSAIIDERLYYLDLGKGMYSLDIYGNDKKYHVENENIYQIKDADENDKVVYFCTFDNTTDPTTYSLYQYCPQDDTTEMLSNNEPEPPLSR